MPKTEATIPQHQIDNFIRRMTRLPEEIKPEVLEDMGDALIGEAQVDAPKLTGFLGESHYRDDFQDDGVRIGANADYALPVHETHPTKSQWFMQALIRNFARVSRKAMIKALRAKGIE